MIGLILGCNSTDNGSYQLIGPGQIGSYSTGFSEYIGNSGTGSFTQSAGTNSVFSSLYLGYNSTATGTYTLSDTGTLYANSLCVGYSGAGTFTQSGGNNSTTTTFLGYNPQSRGLFDLSGSGTLTASSDEYVGCSGTGTFLQSGGRNSTAALYLGYNPQSSGTYSLSDSGVLYARNQYVGGSGTGLFTQTGGTNTVTCLNVAPNGTYTLTAGTLNINAGLLNQGVFDLSNSSAAINASSAIVDLSGALLSNSKNVALSLDAHSLLIVPAGLDASAYFVNYRNDGLVHQVGSTLTIPAGYSISGVGTITDYVDCQGTLTASSGSIGLKNGLYLSNGGNVNLSNGPLYVNDAISGINSGLLSSYGSQYVGYSGTGTFTQSGGSVSMGSLYLGYNAGDSGTYLLNSNSRFSGDLYVGYSGVGHFVQSSDVSATKLYIGYNAGSIGTYEMNAAMPAMYVYVGYSGAGTLTQSAGVNQSPSPSSGIYVGCNAGSNGCYLITGGTASAGCEYVGYSGTGTFVQSGGVNNIPGVWTSCTLYVGDLAGSNGAYDLSGSGLLSAYRVNVGNSGVGVFTQSGGTNTVSSYLTLGASTGGSGSYILSDGVLSAPGRGHRQLGRGAFTQTGGTNTVSTDINLAYQPGSSGIYSLGGTGNLASRAIYVGYYGAGTFSQSGGSNTIGFGDDSVSGLYIAYNSGANGVVNQSGGTNTISGSLYLACNSGATATYALSGTGSLSAPTQYVGYGGSGTFNHSGGTNSVSGNLYLAYGSASSGVYSLSGTGKLSATNEYVGYGASATATFNQTGGANSTGFLSIGPGSRYILSGGSLQVNGTGISNQGVFDGGNCPVTVTADNCFLDMSSGTWENLKGTSLNMGANSITFFPAGFNVATDLAGYSSAGFTHFAGTTLAIAAGKSLSIDASFSTNDFVSCQGNLSTTSGNSINLNNGLSLTAGSVSLGDGALTVNDAVSAISSGALDDNKRVRRKSRIRHVYSIRRRQYALGRPLPRQQCRRSWDVQSQRIGTVVGQYGIRRQLRSGDVHAIGRKLFRPPHSRQ